MPPRTTPRNASSRSAAPGQRQLRVGEEMRHALARIFERGTLRDPALQEASLTVTEVRVAPDLKRATAFIMPLAGRNAAEIMSGLRRGAGHLRQLLAQEIRLRVAPELVFALDESFDRASRIEQLLRRDDVARDLAKAEEDGADAAAETEDSEGEDEGSAQGAGEAEDEDGA